MGNEVPLVGGLFLRLGEAFPLSGERFPQVRDEVPLVGELFPRLGEAFPLLGQRFPQVGEAFPRLKMKAQWFGNYFKRSIDKWEELWGKQGQDVIEMASSSVNGLASKIWPSTPEKGTQEPFSNTKAFFPSPIGLKSTTLPDSSKQKFGAGMIDSPPDLKIVKTVW